MRGRGGRTFDDASGVDAVQFAEHDERLDGAERVEEMGVVGLVASKAAWERCELGRRRGTRKRVYRPRSAR